MRTANSGLGTPSRLANGNRPTLGQLTDNAYAVDVHRREASRIARSGAWISLHGSIVPQSRPNALLLTPADTVVQRVPYAPEASKLQRPRSGAEILGISRAAIQRRGSRSVTRKGGKARILGISSNPNLKAQVSKLGQNRERLHSGWQAFSQVHDALGRTVTEELGRLS